ncbi:hypothetical protein MMC17_003236 [Xylographa soralifera]|nr:hypothetical protein [Xylographa soralifera]
MQRQSAPMDYFQADASHYWDAYASPSRTPVRNVTSSFSVTTSTVTTTTSGLILEDDDGNEYYECTPPFPSPSPLVPSTPRCAARHVSWQPAAESHHSRRGSYGQYNQHFIDAERRDLELSRLRYQETHALRQNPAEKLYRKVNSVVDKAVKKPWKKIMGKIRRKSQLELEDRRQSYVMEDSSSTSVVYIEYADDVRLRGGKARA